MPTTEAHERVRDSEDRAQLSLLPESPSSSPDIPAEHQGRIAEGLRNELQAAFGAWDHRAPDPDLLLDGTHYVYSTLHHYRDQLHLSEEDIDEFMRYYVGWAVELKIAEGLRGVLHSPVTHHRRSFLSFKSRAP